MKIRKTYEGVVPTGKLLNSYSTSSSDTYNCEYINLIGKTITMSSENKSSQSLSINTLTKVTNMTNEDTNQFTNEEITYSNGYYTINSDRIHTILVNSQLFFQSATNAQMYIAKNDVNIVQSSLNNVKQSFTFVVPVQKNDKISIQTYVEVSGNSLRADHNNFSQVTVLN